MVIGQRKHIYQLISQMKDKFIVLPKLHTVSFVLIAILVNICALLVFSGQIQAADYGGPYLGGSLGTAYNAIQVESDTNSDNISTQEGFLSYWAGFGMVKDNIYYGLEIDFFINDTKDDTDSIREKYSPIIRSGYVYPDLFYNDVLLYGLIGWQASQARYNSASNMFYGPRLGAGLEYQIRKKIYNNQEESKIFFRGELNYIHYSQEDLGDNSNDVTLSPNSLNVQFGIGFRF